MSTLSTIVVEDNSALSRANEACGQMLGFSRALEDKIKINRRARGGASEIETNAEAGSNKEKEKKREGASYRKQEAAEGEPGQVTGGEFTHLELKLKQHSFSFPHEGDGSSIATSADHRHKCCFHLEHQIFCRCCWKI
ncbi:hypothetical protein LguiB_026970 [Lonicera macranthoides]